MMLGSLAGLAIGNPLPLLFSGVRRAWGFLGGIAAQINPQGWLGLAASLFLFVHFGGAARHWHKLADHQAVLIEVANQSVYNLRMASFEAADKNRATVDRDTAARAAITKETNDVYQAQLARLRADPAFRVRSQAGAGQGHAGNSGPSALPAPAGGTAAAPMSVPDTILLLAGAETELQLNALIDWVERQHAIDPNKP
jgi:hypothetical protein